MSPFHPKFKKAAGETALTIGAAVTAVIGGFAGLIAGGIVGLPVSFIWGLFTYEPRAVGANPSISEQDNQLFGPVIVCAWIGAGVGFLLFGGGLVLINLGRLLMSLIKRLYQGHTDRARRASQLDNLEVDARQQVEREKDHHIRRMAAKEARKQEAMRQMRDAAGHHTDGEYGQWRKLPPG